MLRLPPPPKAAQVKLDGSSDGEVAAADRPSVQHLPAAAPTVALAQVPQVGGVTTGATQAEAPDMSPDRLTERPLRRPSLEILLDRAESLAHSLSISDPKGRLLQVALMRRDHTLLEAIVKSVDGTLPTHRPTIARTANRAATIRPGRNSHVRRRPHTERPIPVPRRARQT